MYFLRILDPEKAARPSTCHSTGAKMWWIMSGMTRNSCPDLGPTAIWIGAGRIRWDFEWEMDGMAIKGSTLVVWVVVHGFTLCSKNTQNSGSLSVALQSARHDWPRGPTFSLRSTLTRWCFSPMLLASSWPTSQMREGLHSALMKNTYL